MPLFGHHDSTSKQSVKAPTSPPAPTPVAKDTAHRRSGLFGSRSSKQTSPTRTTHTVSSVQTNGSTESHRASLLHKDAEDSSITAARERVIGAEAAERDADKALLMAKSAVREAREHVKRLEKEAAEQ
jgi:hypothetical protein